MTATNTLRLAVITGGGQGIGLAAAHAFAQEKFSVVIAGRNETRLRDAAAELHKARSSVEIMTQRCDVSSPESVDKLFAAVRERFGSINVLFNNAGIAHTGATVDKLPIENWKQVIDTNLTGTFLVTRAALPLMQAGATVVNNLSIAAQRIFPGMAAYIASKAGALALTNVLRDELRKRGIRVLALLPGAVSTEIWNQFWPDAPKDKMLSPETVARAVVNAALLPEQATIEEIRIGPVTGVL